MQKPTVSCVRNQIWFRPNQKRDPNPKAPVYTRPISWRFWGQPYSTWQHLTTPELIHWGWKGPMGHPLGLGIDLGERSTEGQKPPPLPQPLLVVTTQQKPRKDCGTPNSWPRLRLSDTPIYTRIDRQTHDSTLHSWVAQTQTHLQPGTGRRFQGALRGGVWASPPWRALNSSSSLAHQHRTISILAISALTEPTRQKSHRKKGFRAQKSQLEIANR